MLYYTHDASLPETSWRMVGIRGDRLTTTVDEIMPDTEYLFKIQAKNDKGHSPMSAPKVFKTMAIAGVYIFKS